MTGPSDGARRALALLLALVALSAALALHQAFLAPWSLAPAPFAIQDDARQFLAWMPRLTGAPVVPGDILSDYWQDVAPKPYALLYALAARLGAEPVLVHRLLPLPLLAAAAVFGFRIALRLTGAPWPAFVAAAFLMAFLVHEDSIFSATPRAFSMPLFLAFLDSFQRGRSPAAVAALAALAAIYPTTALVGLGILGLARVRLRPRPAIDLSRGALFELGSAAGAILAAALLLGPAASAWGPTLRLAEAPDLPNLMRPEGRSTLTDASGAIGWICNQRMGLVPEVVPCWPELPWAPVPNILFLLPLLGLAAGAARGSARFNPEGRNGLYLLALLSCLAWYAVATAAAFDLHLPSRYTQRILGPLEWLAIGQVVGLSLQGLSRRRGGRLPPAAALALGGVLLALFSTPLPGYQRPADPAAMRHLLETPPGTRVAGLSADLDFVPALTGRPVFATVEHAIPFHRGYGGAMERRLGLSLAALSSPDPAAPAAFLELTGVDLLLLDRALLERGRLSPRYAGVVPREAAAAEARFRAGGAALQRVWRGCALPGTGPVVILEAGCLRGRLEALP